MASTPAEMDAGALPGGIFGFWRTLIGDGAAGEADGAGHAQDAGSAAGSSTPARLGRAVASADAYRAFLTKLKQKPAADPVRNYLQEHLRDFGSVDVARLPLDGQDSAHELLRALQAETLRIMRSLPLWRDAPSVDWTMEREFLERLVMTRVRKKVLGARPEEREEDALLRRRCIILGTFVTGEQIGVPDAALEDSFEPSWASAVSTLGRLDSVDTPRDKLDVLARACIKVCKLLTAAAARSQALELEARNATLETQLGEMKNQERDTEDGPTEVTAATATEGGASGEEAGAEAGAEADEAAGGMAAPEADEEPSAGMAAAESEDAGSTTGHARAEDNDSEASEEDAPSAADAHPQHTDDAEDDGDVPSAPAASATAAADENGRGAADAMDTHPPGPMGASPPQPPMAAPAATIDHLPAPHHMPAADDLLPSLIYLVVRTAPRHFPSNLHYASRFRHPDSLSGAMRYFLTLMDSAATFLAGCDSSQFLGLSAEVWEEGWVAGEAAFAELVERERAEAEAAAEAAAQDARAAAAAAAEAAASSSAAAGGRAEAPAPERADAEAQTEPVAVTDLPLYPPLASATAEGVGDWRAARFRFVGASPHDIRVGDIPLLLAEYHNLAQTVWNISRRLGVEPPACLSLRPPSKGERAVETEAAVEAAERVRQEHEAARGGSAPGTGGAGVGNRSLGLL